MGKKNKSLFRKVVKEKVDAKLQNFKKSPAWQEANLWAEALDDNTFYIYKPWRFIFREYTKFLIEFGLLTLISSINIVLFLYVVPIWLIALHGCYVRLKIFEKYNISIAKSFVLFFIFEILFIVVSPFVRSGIQWLVFGLISGSFFKYA